MKALLERVEQLKKNKMSAAKISEAASVGDFAWQGDMKITVIDKIGSGMNRIDNPDDLDRQLVPGNTHGSNHCLSSLDGIELYWPDGWTHDASYDRYEGPEFVTKKEVTIEHPTHPHVIVPAGMSIGIDYQRVYDNEQKRERRQLD